MFICDESIKKALEERAEAEHRTVSNLVEMIVLEDLRSSSSPVTQKSPDFDATALVKSLLEPLTDTDIIVLSHDYDLDPKLLVELRDRLRKTNGNGHEINRQS